VNYICKSCYYQIRNIGLIRKYINDETCKTCAARQVTRTRKREHLTSVFPAALAPYTFKITVQDLVSYIQSIEWNSTTVSKRSDRKLYTSENAAI